MKNVSDSFRGKIKQPYRRFSVRATIGGVEYAAHNIETFKINSSIGNADMISLGAFVADDLQISMINNADYAFNEDDPIMIFVTLEGEPEICLGKFYVDADSVERTKMNTTVSALGIAGRLSDMEYVTNLTFPASLSSMVNELETRYNLTFLNKDLLPNIQYKSKPIGTVRAMISEIAQLCGANIRERFESLDVHQLEFVFTSDTDEVLTADNYFSFKRLSDVPISITKLFIEKNDVAIVDGEELEADDLVYGTDDGYAVKITNEHIENETELKTMYDKSFPYTFIPFECELQGMPHIEVGDLIIINELVNQKIFTGHTTKYEIGFNAIGNVDSVIGNVDSVIFNDVALPDEIIVNEETYVPEVITDVTEAPLQLHVISHTLEYNGGFKSTFTSACPDESMLAVGSNGVRMEDIIKRTEKYISMWKVENDRILGMVAKLNGDVTEMVTKYEQTADEIRLVAERLGEENEQLKAQLSVMADQISLRVSEIRNEVEVKVSEVLQTVDMISLKVSEIDGVKEKVGQLEVTSESIRSSVETLENDLQTGISEINQTVDSITHTVTALENGQETFKTEVDQTIDSIAHSVTALENGQETFKTEINQTIDSITHTVTQLENGSETLQTQIEQTIDSITQSVTQIENNMTTAFSEIRQEISEINLEIGAFDKVTGEEIVTKINMTPEAISMLAQALDLTGFVTFRDLEGNTETKINGNAIETGTINVLQSTPNSNSNLTITDSGIEINSDESGDFIKINGQNTGLRIWSGIWATVIQGIYGNDPNSGGIAIGAHDNYGMIKCYPRNYGQANRAGKVEIAAPVIFNNKVYQSTTGNVTDDDGYITKAELIAELEKWEPEGGGDAGGSTGSGSEMVGDLKIVIEKAVDNPDNETYMEDEYFRYSYNKSQRTCYPNVKKETPLPADYMMPDFILFQGALFEVVNTGLSSLWKNQTVDTFTININAYQIGAFDATFSLRKLTIKNENGKLHTVTSGSFYRCSTLEEVELPKSISVLGSSGGSYGVFQECVNLRTVVFKEGTELENVGYALFRGCVSLERITLPPLKPYSGTSYYLGSNLFYGCKKLQYADVSGLPYIPSYAFYECVLLSELKVGTPTKLDNYAFYGCESLTDFSVESVETIGSNVFQNCTSLSRINLPKVKTTTQRAFANTAIRTEQDIILASEAALLYNYLFENCQQLVSYRNDTVTQVYGGVFNGCTNLRTVQLNYVGSVGGAIFIDCVNLTEVEMDSVPSFTYSVSSAGYAFLEGKTNLRRASFQLLTEVQYKMFMNCVNLREVNLPNVTKVKNYAFQNCAAITSCNLNFSSLIEIGAYAFQNCTWIRHLDLRNVARVDDYAFDGIDLDSFSISRPSSLSATAYVYMDSYCISSSTITVLDLRNIGHCSLGSNAFANMINLTAVYLPYGTLSISSNAFPNARNCTFYFYSQAHFDEQTAYKKGARSFKTYFLDKEEYNNTVAFW